MAEQKLFTPIRVGITTLQHRIVFAPLTRLQPHPDRQPRSRVRGTLLITDATFISPQVGGFADAPGIWSTAQIEAWKQVVDAVHARGSFIYLQLWALGRWASPEVLEKEGPYPFVGASAIPIPWSHKASTLPSDRTSSPRPSKQVTAKSKQKQTENAIDMRVTEHYLAVWTSCMDYTKL
ncbi:hypothetical protein BC629DRAFT_1434220 [Irpex lacteus]|nr:hypothetical protein BC629DRAFT_1434220 [Irpex lacteus]